MYLTDTKLTKYQDLVIQDLVVEIRKKSDQTPEILLYKKYNYIMDDIHCGLRALSESVLKGENGLLWV